MAEQLLKVDVSKIAAGVLGRLPTPDDRARALRGLAAAAMHFWKRQALEKLRSTSRDYIAGLQEDVQSGKAVLTLVGVLPNLIEQGFKGGDMRTYMLNGPRVKRSQDGSRYLTVPFRHGTPGTTGRNVGHVMPVSIYQAAKKLAGTVSRPGAGVGGSAGRAVLYGERLNASSPGASPQARRILLRKEKSWHATSIYTGMIREEKQFAKAKQTTGYTTFRTLSEKVKRADEHWLHPGIQARAFASDTVRYVGRIAKDIIASSVK
ncbi:MAG TPA: hypothetical protein VIK52_14045 [Opitutaceae bacterium]